MSEYDAEELAAQLQSENSRENIKKRRSQRARRRRMAFLKGIFRLICTIFLLAAVGIGGYYVVGWGVQAYRDVRDMYEAYLIRQEANRGEVDVRFDGYTNVLVLGLDDAVNMDNAEEKRADAILLISMENATGKVRILNIPRDTWVKMAQDKGETRLANVYAVGGAPLMVRTINQMFDISIHQYVVIDLATFGQIVDAVGGIDLLFQVRGDEHDGLIQIERFADRLESGRGDVTAAASHVMEELLIVDAVKRQRVVHPEFRRGVTLVPEEMQADVRVGVVPAAHFVLKALIEHIAEDVIPFRGLQVEHLTPEERRHDRDAFPGA